MSEEYMNNNEVIETEDFETEVTTDNTPAVYPTEIYVPETEGSESSGPNKALIALGIGGGLLIGKKLINKYVKPKIEEKKAKKAAEEEERILRVLEKTGLVKPAEEVKDGGEKTVDVPAEAVQESKPEETKAEEKTETK